MRPRNAAGGVISYFARHRTAANLLLVVLIVLGLAAFPRMRAQFFPDVIVDDVERLGGMARRRGRGRGRRHRRGAGARASGRGGRDESSARSAEGRRLDHLEFEPGWDMGRAADDVPQAVDAVTNLPEAAEDPEIRRGGWRDRVTDVVITGPVGVDQLGRFADEFIARLFAEGVTRTTIRGVAAPEITVEVPSLR